jgi:outer membrane receptor protein involved in Fe transport
MDHLWPTFPVRYFSAKRHSLARARGRALGWPKTPGSGPASWKTDTRGYNAPRAGFTWQPNDDTSWRFAVGWSIAPPYLALLSSPGTAPSENINAYPAGGYTQNLNNGDIAPETAFSYDIGLDQRFHRSMFVSVDAYLTNLRDMYLPSTFLINPNYDPPGCPAIGDCPLYASQTQNVGHARYEGLELAVGEDPISGFGFRLQGDLMRAYVYDLPQGFYCTNVPANQCTPFNYDTNLGILPNINFQQGATGYNSVNGAAVPYSMGYAELNYRTLPGAFVRIGATYFGPNNPYSRPAFFVLSAGIREPLGSHLALQLTANNLNGVYDQLWANQEGGVPAVLAPECVGKYGGPAFFAVGTACTALVNSGAVPRSAVAVVPQEGLTDGSNYGPTTFELRLIEKIGGP